MVKYQTINSVYLIIGGFVLVFIAIYISICVYCFLKKQRQKQQNPKLRDPYDLNRHERKEMKGMKIGQKKTKKIFHDKDRFVYKAGAYKPLKSSAGSKVIPIPSGIEKGVAVPMTVDSIGEESGENLLANDAAYKDIISRESQKKEEKE
uniref:Uncharacterized protein n=3 Tax=Meloidogyne TaxID=189290 RepID=A0A6V7X915_MELEN|nr:unnamed protein product [Meloidogyne enterolobii]